MSRKLNLMKKEEEKIYKTDLRIIVRDETEYYLKKWRRENEIKKIYQFYLYDRNRAIYICSTEASFWLEPLYRRALPNDDKQYDALIESNPSDAHYVSRSDLSEDDGIKVVKIDEDLNFEYKSEDEYRDELDDVIEYISSNPLGMETFGLSLEHKFEKINDGTFFIRRGTAFKLPEISKTGMIESKPKEDLDKEYIKVYENLNKGKHAIWQGKVTKQFEEYMDLIKKGREGLREGYELGHWANDSNRYGEEESNASTGYLIKYKGDYLLVNAEGNFVYEVLIADPEEQEGFIKDLIEHFEKEE